MVRIAILDKKKCSPKKCGFLCISVCPGVRMGDETIVEGEDNYPIISEELCTGCGICVKKCPYDAIKIINLTEEVGNPLHQFGKNSFRVYALPSPRKGVVGIIGRNGIGKSTIVKILAGVIKPNLGNYENPPEWEEILENFKGHDIYNYLKDLSEGKAKMAYKIQEVDRIPSQYKGIVRDMLKKVDQKGILDELAEKLEITNCLGRKLSEISGGELQRVAIAATIMKEADYYFFDEPSSYLDVKQRINVAKVLRELAQDKTVFVVEHDLAILDYLSDYIHVLYGVGGAYGIVSGLKNSRVGINEFLDGYLKAENTRIRDYSIVFPPKPPAEEWLSKEEYHYANFKKAYPDFNLEVEKGTLKKGETIGILGPNAIGKSTFFKVLSGKEKADEGNPNFKVKISYKPQYIEIKEKGRVYDYIYKSDIDKELFNSMLKKVVEDLFEKNLENLSGGEMQRLAIIMALAKNTDVCLLDEPSAFLDIEQRLKLAELIKRVTENKEITTIVIDHDIVFEDTVANRIINFKGESGKHGLATSPKKMEEGMNEFLKFMEITFRREPGSGRPRINKKDSQKDKEQKKSGNYYYMMG